MNLVSCGSLGFHPAAALTPSKKGYTILIFLSVLVTMMVMLMIVVSLVMMMPWHTTLLLLLLLLSLCSSYDHDADDAGIKVWKCFMNPKKGKSHGENDGWFRLFLPFFHACLYNGVTLQPEIHWRTVLFRVREYIASVEVYSKGYIGGATGKVLWRSWKEQEMVERIWKQLDPLVLFLKRRFFSQQKKVQPKAYGRTTTTCELSDVSSSYSTIMWNCL